VGIKNLLELLVPQQESENPRFRTYIDHLSVIGLRVVAAVCFSGVFYFAMVGLLFSSIALDQFGLAQPVTITTLGVFAVAFSFWRGGRSHARLAGMVVGYGVAVVQFVTAASVVDRPEVGVFLFSGIVTGVMLIGITALPLKPLQTLGLGTAIVLTYGLSRQWVVPAGSDAVDLVMVAQVVFLCTALTMVVYRQRALGYRARQSAREALQELRSAQARLLVSENAHSQTRFAAALSHELNTPLGALKSALDTLLHVYKKEGLASDPRYADILAGAEAAGRGSAARLQETVERMRFLTNLDRAEEQTVDLNELCRQTAASLKAELEEKSALDFDLGVIPPIRCRPQQLSAVLSNLLRNASDAIETRGRITVVTRKQKGNIVLEVRDTGKGISKEQLETLFEPVFQVEDGRVATTNWGLFVSRTIVSEHAGELAIESELGAGTTAKMVLPWT
jgi:signal transduction histidine kinase